MVRMEETQNRSDRKTERTNNRLNAQQQFALNKVVENHKNELTGKAYSNWDHAAKEFSTELGFPVTSKNVKFSCRTVNIEPDWNYTRTGGAPSLSIKVRELAKKLTESEALLTEALKELDKQGKWIRKLVGSIRNAYVNNKIPAPKGLDELYKEVFPQGSDPTPRNDAKATTIINQ